MYKWWCNQYLLVKRKWDISCFRSIYKGIDYENQRESNKNPTHSRAVVCKGIVFDRKSFTYSFSKELPDSLDGRQILDNLKEIPEFQKRNRRDQNSLLNDMEELIVDINDNCSKIRKTLVCPRCGSQYRSRDIRYMVCDCGFICDVTDDGIRFFHQQKDGSLSNITAKGWGMDLVEQ